MFLWFIITVIKVQTNSYNRYKWETLAHLIGQSGFLKKSDTVINAFQLEKDPDNNQSKDLANSFISKVSDTLNDVSTSEILNSNHLFRLKKWTVCIMFLSIIVFSVYHQQNADAFYRWKHYKKQFSAGYSQICAGKNVIDWVGDVILCLHHNAFTNLGFFHYSFTFEENICNFKPSILLKRLV